MMPFNIKYREVIGKAEHLIALGQADVFLHEDEGFPWNRVTDIEGGAGYRFNGPTGFYAIAEEAGLRLKLSVDFESRDANGRGVSLFDRDKLRAMALKLPPAARLKFAAFLSDKVLPDLAKRTAEIRQALNAQSDSEDCVRGLIAFAESQQ